METWKSKLFFLRDTLGRFIYGIGAIALVKLLMEDPMRPIDALIFGGIAVISYWGKKIFFKR